MPIYKFITIENGGTPYIKTQKPLFRIINNRSQDVLGSLFWYPAWKQWVFEAEPQALFSGSCLHDILDFMENHDHHNPRNGNHHL